jgi:hypothetical protein
LTVNVVRILGEVHVTRAGAVRGATHGVIRAAHRPLFMGMLFPPPPFIIVVPVMPASSTMLQKAT